ncbi:MAG: hypothetical protein JJT95_06755 [Pararhodobacter sp.]|nr:hypothetical protein [Pararhodobacter sp.]
MDTDLSRRDDAAQHDARAQQAMNWYGFGSPVGLAILILAIGLSTLCLRIALFGLPG